MPISSVERQNYYPVSGTSALEPEVCFQPQFRIVPNPEVELAVSNIVSLSDFKARKNREAILKTTPVESKPAITSKDDLLKGTGFTSSEEANSLKQKFNDGRAEGKNIQEVVNKIVIENLTNIRWYQWEYTMSDPIIPNPVAQDENKELVNSKSGYSVVAMTGEGERDGSVKESVINAQNLLTDAKEGDTVMIVSPPGWTGRRDDNGKEIEYPEAEIFAFIKGEGRNIRALTFISELTLEQCEEFRRTFITPDAAASDKKLSEREKIVEMVASPILVTGGRVNFENILDRVQAIKGGELMREANGANRTFAEAREFLARGDELQKLPDLCEEIIQKYEGYLREHIENINNPETFNAIKQRMELTVLEIAKTLKGDKKGESPKQMSVFYVQAMSSVNVIDQRLITNNYDAQIAYLKTRPGCNGGGSSESSGIFGSSLAEILSGGSVISGGGGIGESSSSLAPKCMNCKLELCEGRCPNCEKKASRAA